MQVLVQRASGAGWLSWSAGGWSAVAASLDADYDAASRVWAWPDGVALPPSTGRLSVASSDRALSFGRDGINIESSTWLIGGALNALRSIGDAIGGAFNRTFGSSTADQRAQADLGTIRGTSVVTRLAGADALRFGNGALLIAIGNGQMVAAGGGNIVAAGGGNIIAAGGGNFVSNTSGLLASTRITLIGQDGNSLIGQDGNSFARTNGAGLLSVGGAKLAAGRGNTLIGQDGNSLIATDAASLIGQDGNS